MVAYCIISPVETEAVSRFISQQMDTQADFGQTPVMELGPNTKSVDTSRQHKKKLSGIKKIEGMQPRTEGIPGIEDRRLLALQRHIKRKRRRRPYVKKTSKLGEACTAHQNQTCSENPEKKRPGDSGVFDIADEKCSSYDTGVCLKKEFEENFGERSKNRQDAQFDRLVGHLLARIEVELLQKVEAGLNDQSVEKEDQTKEEERAYWEKRAENFPLANAKDLNIATMHQVAGLVENHVNDDTQMKDFQNDKLKQSEKMLDHTERDKLSVEEDIRNKIVDEGTLEAVQFSQTSCSGQNSTKSVDSKADVGKINQQAIVDDDCDDDDDEDDGFMPRKLFFFCFSHCKKEETSTSA